MPTKKKSKAATASDTSPDPRAPIAPTPANLTATLKELKAVLAGIEPPVLPEPKKVEPKKTDSKRGGKGATKATAADADAAAQTEGADAAGEAAAPEKAQADSKKVDPKKAAAEKAAAEKAAEEAVEEPAEDPVTRLDLVDAMLHIYFASGLPCGYGQEALRRIDESFVDRNEFRVTEAFEVEDLLRDLDIPDLFDRCLAVRDSVAQVYNDQNGVSLAFLRTTSISDRNMFFQRVPALQPHVVTFLTSLLTIEEICFSEKSTLRAQQRLGLDPKSPAISKFIDELRACLKPYGHLPLVVGPQGSNGKPNLKRTLSPACVLARLAPPGKKR